MKRLVLGGKSGMVAIAGSEDVPSVGQLVKRAVGKFGRNIYIRPFEPEIPDISYADLKRFVSGYARFLDEAGIPESSAVACIFPNSTLMALLMVATMASGRRFVPLHPNHTARDVDHVFANAQPRLAIHCARVNSLAALAAVKTYVVSDDLAFIEEMLEKGSTGAFLETESDTIAEYVFTSGSSGRPKGVVLSHRNVLANSGFLVERYKGGEADRFLTAVPLFHAGGQAFTTLGPIWVGASTTIVPPEIALVRFWELAAKFQITWTVVMTAFLNVLLSKASMPGRPSLKGLLAGGSHVGAQLIRDFEARFNVPVYQVYGCTEMTSVTVSETIGDTRRTVGSGGKVLESCRLRIMRPDQTEAAVNEPGEIWLDGPQRFQEYLNMPSATAEKIACGFVRTGDMGFIDGNGNLSILDRMDNMILVGGENIYPAEIEILACELPWLEDIIVSGIPHPILGSQLALLYKVRDGTRADDVQLAAMLRAHLISSKVPQIRLPITAFGLEDWPRTAAGKLSRTDVQNLVRAAYERHGPHLVKKEEKALAL